VPDLSTYPWVKTTVAVLTGLNFVITVIDGGLTWPECVNLILAMLGVLGVAAAPATLHLVRSGLAARPSSRT
jgi:uncharacterized membrane protein